MVIDNDLQLKSFLVDLQSLEMMTGLRFNLGDCKDLLELDEIGLSKAMGELHLEFYTRYFIRANSFEKMRELQRDGLKYGV
jgi:hypothetical protein